MKIEDILYRSPIIPVIVVEQLAHAVPLARALVEGGLPVLEITLRSEAAMAAVEAIAESVADAIVGVGTVTRPAQFQQARAAGARFVVSPGLTDELITASEAAGLPFLPGAFTPSEVMHAQAKGFRALKLFPARQAGGIGMLKALHGPFPDTVFCPTGGISADDFTDYLALSNVACVGGSWVCPADAVSSGDWDRISRLARDVHSRLAQNT